MAYSTHLNKKCTRMTSFKTVHLSYIAKVLFFKNSVRHIACKLPFIYISSPDECKSDAHFHLPEPKNLIPEKTGVIKVFWILPTEVISILQVKR